MNEQDKDCIEQLNDICESSDLTARMICNTVFASLHDSRRLDINEIIECYCSTYGLAEDETIWLRICNTVLEQGPVDIYEISKATGLDVLVIDMRIEFLAKGGYLEQHENSYVVAKEGIHWKGDIPDDIHIAFDRQVMSLMKRNEKYLKRINLLEDNINELGEESRMREDNKNKAQIYLTMVQIVVGVLITFMSLLGVGSVEKVTSRHTPGSSDVGYCEGLP